MREKAIEGGKNAEIVERMVQGKANSLYAELALLDQPFVKDETKKVGDLLGEGATIIAFIRWQVGEQV